MTKAEHRSQFFKTKRQFKAAEEQLKILRRELDLLVDALGHDYQFDIREACRIVEILNLPNRITRKAQFLELEKRLALHREAIGWGRPWSAIQLERAFYASGDAVKRVIPKPITRSELEAWVPRIPGRPQS